MCGNWAAGVVRQNADLGMPSPFSSSEIVALNSLGVPANMEGQHRKVWDGLHVSPRLAPSKGAKLCTYFASGFDSPSDPPGAEPSAPAGRRMAGGSPLHFMSLPVLNVLHGIKAGGRPPEHQHPDRGLPPDF